MTVHVRMNRAEIAAALERLAFLEGKSVVLGSGFARINTFSRTKGGPEVIDGIVAGYDYEEGE